MYLKIQGLNLYQTRPKIVLFSHLYQTAFLLIHFLKCCLRQPLKQVKGQFTADHLWGCKENPLGYVTIDETLPHDLMSLSGDLIRQSSINNSLLTL